MKTKSNLDEMQRGKLLKIEEIGVWLAFWGLLAAVIVQLLLKADLTQVIGEICVFALVSVYLCVASIKNGLWTASIAASRKTNALFSIVPAAAIGLVSAVKAFVISGNPLQAALFIQLVVSMAVVYVACFAALEALRLCHDKKRRELDGGEE